MAKSVINLRKKYCMSVVNHAWVHNKIVAKILNGFGLPPFGARMLPGPEMNTHNRRDELVSQVTGPPKIP